MEAREGQALLELLWEHAVSTEFTVRFRWAPGSVAFWDNRCLQHYALWDYWPNERMGHRVTVLGDRPTFDPGASDVEASSIRVRLEPLVS